MNSFKPWKILQLDLSQGIPDLRPDASIQGLLIVFWWHGIPLGHQDIQAAQLPMSATELADLALKAITPAVGNHLLDHGFKGSLPTTAPNPSRDIPPDFQALVEMKTPLQTLTHKLPTAAAGPDTVSVIICTRDRPQQLEQCLRSLQSLPHPPHEVIVVDNAPTSEATRQLVAQYPAIRYVEEPRPGLSIARNTGIRHSTGTLVAFTDDDVVVHQDWVLRLQQGFRDRQVMAVTGLMLPAELETEAQLIFQGDPGTPNWGYQALTFDQQFFEEMRHKGVPVWRIGAGANMAFRREIFGLVGEFDERLGAGASGCSEDSEIWYRILAEGWQCRYEPTAVIFHHHRREMTSLREQLFQYMRGHTVALLIQFERYRHWGNLRRLFMTLPKSYFKQITQELRNPSNHKRSTLFPQIRGCLAGLVFYLQNPTSAGSRT